MCFRLTRGLLSAETSWVLSQLRVHETYPSRSRALLTCPCAMSDVFIDGHGVGGQ